MASPPASTLKTLPTRRGEYRLRHFDLWANRHRVTAVTDALTPGSRVAVVGSCFSESMVRYLRRRGYTAWSHPAGELYNPQIIRIELEHTLDGVPWPLECASPVPGGYTHRFRKRCSSPTEGELRRKDAEMTAEVAGALREADVIIVLVGTTAELWRAAEDDLATNEIPHPASFGDGLDWRLDLGDLKDIRSEVSAIQALLNRTTSATKVYSVCPIPLNATWSEMPVVSANGRSKALLRTALEEELTEPSVYLDLWDWVQAQTGRGTPMQRDGRHFSVAGVDRVMHFAEQRLGAESRPLSAAHRARSAIGDARIALRASGPRRALRQARERAADRSGRPAMH